MKTLSKAWTPTLLSACDLRLRYWLFLAEWAAGNGTGNGDAGSFRERRMKSCVPVAVSGAERAVGM